MLEVKGITKSYGSPQRGGNLSVLKGVSFSLARGESAAITGPSGSGKSTLLNIIGCLDHPDSGEVCFDAREIGLLSERERDILRNREMGFVFQLHHLLPQCTVLENVLLPCRAFSGIFKKGEDLPRERAYELLERVGLSDKLDYYPGFLSGGERQRVAVVRALINRPKLLLADEPTGSLDRATGTALMELLMDLRERENLALLVVTHALEMAEFLNRSYSLGDGLLREDE